MRSNREPIGVRYKILRAQGAEDRPVGPAVHRKRRDRPYAVQVWWVPLLGVKNGSRAGHWWTLGRYTSQRSAEQAFEQFGRGWIGRGRRLRLVRRIDAQR